MSTLSEYQARTNQLLQNPAATNVLYATADVTGWINQARGQVAGEGRCIRNIGSISTVIGQRSYSFASISTVSGVQGVLNIRSIQYGVASGMKWVNARGWTWFNFYRLNNPIPASGFPTDWSQLQPGASGTFYVDPIPDDIYTLYCDVVYYPVNLVDDTTPDAIPYLWSDAVPYYAAYLALLSSQVPARQNDANRMFERFEEFMSRARRFANPDVNTYMYAQASDPVQISKISSPRGGGG